MGDGGAFPPFPPLENSAFWPYRSANFQIGLPTFLPPLPPHLPAMTVQDVFDALF